MIKQTDSKSLRARAEELLVVDLSTLTDFDETGDLLYELSEIKAYSSFINQAKSKETAENLYAAGKAAHEAWVRINNHMNTLEWGLP